MASHIAMPKGDPPDGEYRKVLGLFKYYHRAAVTLAALGLARAALPVFGHDTMSDAWVDRTHLMLCLAGCGYVVAPYTRRFLEIMALVRDRH
ncbi:hypothetical protein [Dactylosporangium sp. NPDC005555]|uniref:hypothetical protein n=1 Tax=Dactylosporangium sp. NPDC005555 TaxID=3154889 RepID=UPI0033B87AEC